MFVCIFPNILRQSDTYEEQKVYFLFITPFIFHYYSAKMGKKLIRNEDDYGQTKAYQISRMV